MHTFEIGLIDTLRVSINDYNPFAFRTSFIILVTLRTLRTLRICGKNKIEFNDLDYILLSIISKIDANTTKKSNLFQLREKYENPNAIILRIASIINTAVKI
jgi:hypothetical protein